MYIVYSPGLEKFQSKTEKKGRFLSKTGKKGARRLQKGEIYLIIEQNLYNTGKLFSENKTRSDIQFSLAARGLLFKKIKGQVTVFAIV